MIDIDCSLTNADRRTVAKATKTLQKSLADLETYHQGIPVEEICTLVEAAGFCADRLRGIYCGHDGRVHESIGAGKYLALTWHRMEVTRQFEIVVYVS